MGVVVAVAVGAEVVTPVAGVEEEVLTSAVVAVAVEWGAGDLLAVDSAGAAAHGWAVRLQAEVSVAGAEAGPGWGAVLAEEVSAGAVVLVWVAAAPSAAEGALVADKSAGDAPVVHPWVETSGGAVFNSETSTRDPESAVVPFSRGLLRIRGAVGLPRAKGGVNLISISRIPFLTHVRIFGVATPRWDRTSEITADLPWADGL